MKEQENYKYVAVYFVILEFLFLFSLFWTHDLTGILWSCNLAPIIFAFAFLTKNLRLVKATINYILIPHLIFIIVALIYFITGLNLINIKIGFTTFSVGFRAVLFHLFSANIALFYTRDIKPDKRSIVYSAIIFFVIYILTLSLTPPDLNINFMSSSKVIFGFDIPLVTFLWPFFVFAVFVIPTYFLQKCLAKKYLARGV